MPIDFGQNGMWLVACSQLCQFAFGKGFSSGVVSRHREK